jgi:prophage regulatory protein
MDENKKLKLEKAKSICQRVAFGRTTLWQKVKNGEFPKPLDQGNGRKAWRSDEVDAWIESRARA